MHLSALTLIAGLTIPWIAGFLCIRTVQSYDNRPGSVMIALSAGLLLAYAAVALILMTQNLLLGSVNPWFPLLLLTPVAVIAVWHSRQGQTRPVPPVGEPSLSGPARLLALVFVLGITVHLAYSLLELLTQPLFPWDAWNVWAYRAKVWFFEGSLVPMQHGREWMLSAEPFRYTSTAINYPYLPSLMHLWAALSLGEWHEALINVPVIFCALAMGLGLAGSIRRAGGSVIISLLTVYLLYSIPLMGAHTSLGGYADIWMAGFAGTGMTMLLCGLLLSQKRLQILGALLLITGSLVKVEGTVWIATALAVYVLLKLSGRQVLLLTTVGIIFITAAALLGLTWINLPLVGEIGYRDGMLLVPMRSNIRIGLQDVSGAYLQSAFVLNSWHLLWPLVLMLLAYVAGPSRGPLRKLMLVFFAVFTATQVVIFVFTSQGEWAQDLTAINRLPLHMLPPILFLVGVTLEANRPAIITILTDTRMRRALVVGMVGAILLGGLGVLGWQANKQGFAPAERLDIAPADLSFVLGSGEYTDQLVRVNEFQDGIALLSSGPTSLDADRLTQLRFKLIFDDDIVSLDQAPAFFWRRADRPLEVSRMTLDMSGFAELAQSEDWSGEILEYGFFFVENRGKPAEIGSVDLQGNSLANTVKQIPRQWLAHTGWSQASSNWLPGGAYEQLVYLTTLLIIIAIVGGVLSWLLAGRRQLFQLTLLCLIAGWFILDARWLTERSWQARLSLGQLLGFSVEERIADGYSGKYFPYLQRLLNEELGEVPARILIIPDPDEELYFGLRARYQLLPHAAQLRPSIPFGHPLTTMDYILFLGDYSEGDPQAKIGEAAMLRWRRLRVDSPKARRWLKLVDDAPEGSLYRLETDEE